MREIEYTVVSANERDDLVDAVNSKIEDEWEPMGGVSISVYDCGDEHLVFFCQAMIREIVDEMP